MKVEFGLQANCSELVAVLGRMSETEILEAMRRIVELTGWSLRVRTSIDVTDDNGNTSQKTVYVLVPADRLEDVYASFSSTKAYVSYQCIDVKKTHDGETARYFGIDVVKLMDVLGDSVPEPIRERFYEMKYHTNGRLRMPYLMLSSSEDIVIESASPTYMIFHYSIDSEFDEGLQITAGDNEIEEFPAFHKARIGLNGQAFAHDGGSMKKYCEWTGYYFLNRRKVLEHIYERVSGNKREFTYEIERLEKNPPLPGTGDLKDREFKYFCRWLYDDET